MRFLRNICSIYVEQSCITCTGDRFNVYMVLLDASCIVHFAMNKLPVKACLHTEDLAVFGSINLHFILKFIIGLSVWRWLQKRNWKEFLLSYIISGSIDLYHSSM